MFVIMVWYISSMETLYPQSSFKIQFQCKDINRLLLGFDSNVMGSLQTWFMWLNWLFLWFLWSSPWTYVIPIFLNYDLTMWVFVDERAILWLYACSDKITRIIMKSMSYAWILDVVIESRLWTLKEQSIRLCILLWNLCKCLKYTLTIKCQWLWYDHGQWKVYTRMI